MKNKKTFLFSILGLLVFLIAILAFAFSDVSSTWNSWGIQEDNTIVYPDFWNYLLLILFKFILYGLVPFFISLGMYIDGKKEKKIGYCILTSLSYWFLTILIIKLLCDSIFEIDKIFGLAIFNSIKDIQTLIGFIVTVILKKNYKFEPGLPEKNVFSFSKKSKTLFSADVDTKLLSDLITESAKNDSTLNTGSFVYALYLDNKIMKIGKAVCDGGIYKRMLQYYNGNETGGLKFITDDNKDLIVVEFFNINGKESAWAAERELQGSAYFAGEEMPWEDKKHN